MATAASTTTATMTKKTMAGTTPVTTMTAATTNASTGRRAGGGRAEGRLDGQGRVVHARDHPQHLVLGGACGPPHRERGRSGARAAPEPRPSGAPNKRLKSTTPVPWGAAHALCERRPNDFCQDLRAGSGDVCSGRDPGCPSSPEGIAARLRRNSQSCGDNTAAPAAFNRCLRLPCSAAMSGGSPTACGPTTSSASKTEATKGVADRLA